MRWTWIKALQRSRSRVADTSRIAVASTRIQKFTSLSNLVAVPRLAAIGLLTVAILIPLEGTRAFGGPSELDLVQRRAAEGDPEALNVLGSAYAEGQGVPQNDQTALTFFEEAANRGHVGAAFNIGMFYELGRGVEKDPVNAFKYYRKAADRGFAAAQFNVGNMCANGIGTKQDHVEAASWFHKAADQGVSEAQFNLGLAYELGRGVRKDEGLARRWYRRASAQNNVRAQYNLAVMLDQGRGAPSDLPDPEGAINLYRTAAVQNFGPAQNNLGLFLAEGRGAAENLVEAFTWLSLAVENGVDSGAREVVAGKLSAAALEQANAFLAELRPQLGGHAMPTAMAGPSSPALAAYVPPSPDPEALASESLLLKKRLAVADSELQNARSENAKLAEAVRLAENLRVEAERRAAVAEASVRKAKLAQARMVSENDGGDSLPVSTTSTDMTGLADRDPRIARLLADNARLTDSAKQANQEISVLRAQLGIAQSKAEARQDGTGLAPIPAADVDQVALLTRKIEVMRRTIEKLAKESRVNSQLNAEMDTLRLENEKLKAQHPRAGGLAATTK